MQTTSAPAPTSGKSPRRKACRKSIVSKSSCPRSPAEREFVEIHDDRILMRGSMIMRPETTRPMWLDHPVPFVVAGMKAGTESPEIQAPAAALSRKTQVIAQGGCHRSGRHISLPSAC